MVDDKPKELFEKIVTELENKKNISDIKKIAKNRKISIQEIKAFLVRRGDESSISLLKQIIEFQEPRIEEITIKFLEGKCTLKSLTEEYGTYSDSIKRLVSEYAFITNREQQYEERKRKKDFTRYKSEDTINNEEKDDSLVLNNDILDEEYKEDNKEENKELDTYLNNIITQIEGGKTLSEIVVGNQTKIKRLLYEQCGDRGRNALITDFERTTPILEILELYNKGLNYKEIEKKLGLFANKVISTVSEYEFLTGKKNIHLYSGIRHDLDKEKIIEEYRLGKPMEIIAKEEDCATITIQKRINEYMIENGDELRKEHDYNYELLNPSPIKPEKKEKYVQPSIQLDSEKIYMKYKTGSVTLRQLAEENHVSVTTIRNRINNYIQENELDSSKKEEKAEKEKKERRKKIATRNSIVNFLSKYNCDYEELSELSKEVGYIIQKEDYDSVIEELNKQGRGEDR